MTAAAVLPTWESLTTPNREAGEAVFKVKDGKAVYVVRRVTPEVAESFGVPGANAILVGENYRALGVLTPATGKLVRVMAAGWYNQRGQLATFDVGADGTLKGWIVGGAPVADPVPGNADTLHAPDTELLGAQVVSKSPTVNPTGRKALRGLLVRTFKIGSLSYGVIELPSGSQGTAPLHSIHRAPAKASR